MQCTVHVVSATRSPTLTETTQYSGTLPAPERRNAFGEVLSTIPAEIYMAIFDEIQPSAPGGSFNETLYKETLANLTLVCHHFRDLCQGRMFKHLRFYGFAAKELDSTSKQIVGRRSWREALLARDPSCVALSDCVKLVTLSSWTSTSKPWTVDQPFFTRLLAQNILSLNALRSLREVHLVYCLVSGPVLDGLAHMFTISSNIVESSVEAKFRMSSDYPRACTFAQVSRSPTVRLKISRSACEAGSAAK